MSPESPRRRCLAAIGLVLAAAFSAASAEPGPSSPPGIDSFYSGKIAALFAKDLEPPAADFDGSLRLLRIDAPANRLYVGLRQEMIVRASVEAVAAVLDDFADYPRMFDDLLRAVPTETGPGAFSLLQEQRVPVPFVKNLTFTLNYLVDDRGAAGKGYLYKLMESNRLKFDDGMIRLSRTREGECRFLEYDFALADWGVLGGVAPSKIWAASISGTIVSDLSVKLRAEHPDWDLARVRAEAKREASKYDLRRIVSETLPADAAF